MIVTHELSALLSAGLPLDRSLGTLVELADKPALKVVVADVLQSVRGGKSLADAFAKHSFFPPLYVNMVRAGEVGGFLDVVLQRLVEYLESTQELRDEARAALAYPVVLTGAMGVSIMVLLVYVLPKFSALFSDMGKTLPLSARIVMTVSDAIRGYWWAGLGGIALLVLSVRYYIRTPSGSLAWDQWKLRLFIVGNVAQDGGVKIARTLDAALRAAFRWSGPRYRWRVAGNQVVARSRPTSRWASAKASWRGEAARALRACSRRSPSR